MSKLSPEKQTAYDRWEMANFGDNRPVALAEEAARHTALSMQQLAEVAQLKEDAKLAGHAEGYAAGHSEGLAQAENELKLRISGLEKIEREFSAFTDEIKIEASAELLELALDISRSILKTAIDVNPELILQTINKCIKDMPFNQGLIITVHPKDFAVVSQAFSIQVQTQNWLIVEDEEIGPGGCLLDTAKNHINATIDQRWKDVVASVGSLKPWITDAKD